VARPAKVAAVTEIADRFRDSSAAVVTEYRGLSVSALRELRRTLGPGATYRVAKNTLVRRAAADAGVAGLDDLLAGAVCARTITVRLKPTHLLHPSYAKPTSPISPSSGEAADDSTSSTTTQPGSNPLRGNRR